MAIEAAVDVIIAAWNRADTIERAVRSALADRAVASVIVVDDASSDDTAHQAEILAREDPRVMVVRMPRNGGPSAARNRALVLGGAPWVAVLDGDDYVHADRFSRLLREAEGWDFVADDLLQVNDGAPPETARRLLGIEAGRVETINLATFVDANISRPGRSRREMGFLKPLMRREFLERNQLRYDETVRLGEDYLLYARAMAMGARFCLVPAAGYVAVIRAGSLSGRHSRQDLEALLAADRRLLACPELPRDGRAAVRRHCEHVDGKVQWLVVIEAVKARDFARFIRAFTISPVVSVYVAGKLLGEAFVRLRRRVGGSTPNG